jgi:lactoylglutathione lyase
MRTLHVGLRVADLERSLAFYTSLGYEIVGEVPATEFGSLTMLKLPGDEFVSLELVHDPALDRVEPGGLNHLVIKVEAMGEILAHLEARGVETEPPSSPDQSEDFWTAWLTDPDGYRIELVQWPLGHPDGLTHSDMNGPDVGVVSGRSAKEVVYEMFRRRQAGDGTALDDLVAADMVNHAAGPQGREGLRQILRTIDVDLGPIAVEQHHLIGEGDLVAQHLTLHGTHRASTMPLLADTTVSGRPTAWTFIHIWRVSDGLLVEHWACRDDMGLLEQLARP